MLKYLLLFYLALLDLCNSVFVFAFESYVTLRPESAWNCLSKIHV